MVMMAIFQLFRSAGVGNVTMQIPQNLPKSAQSVVHHIQRSCPAYLPSSALMVFHVLYWVMILPIYNVIPSSFMVVALPMFVYCTGICYGFQLMRVVESPNTPFTVLYSRFVEGMHHTVLHIEIGKREGNGLRRHTYSVTILESW